MGKLKGWLDRNPHTNYFLLFLGIYIFVGSLAGLKSAWGVAFAVEGNQALAQSVVYGFVGNPVSGLFAGLLITTLIQSSSASIAIAIATVGAGALPIELAIPIVLGANIGTTVTNTLVSLGHITRRAEFERAAAASMIDDVFKVFNVTIFFIIEIYTHALSRSALWLATKAGEAPVISALLSKFPDFTEIIVDGPIVEPFVAGVTAFFGASHFMAAGVVGVVSVAFLLLALKIMSDSMQRTLKDKAESFVDRAFKTRGRGFATGLGLTVLLQSSSVTTSLMIPFAAAGLIKLEKAYPYVLGAAIGTTVDPSQIVSYAKFGVTGFKVGFVHVLLNVFGVLIWLLTPLRILPLTIANWLAKKIIGVNRLMFIAYTIIFFYIVPAAVIYLLRS